MFTSPKERTYALRHLVKMKHHISCTLRILPTAPSLATHAADAVAAHQRDNGVIFTSHVKHISKQRTCRVHLFPFPDM